MDTYRLGGAAALERASVALVDWRRVGTRNGGGSRKERESENEDRGSTSEHHLEFFVE